MSLEYATIDREGRAEPASPRHHRSRWLSVVSHLDPKYGGLSAVAPQLASRLRANDQIHTSLGAFCLEGEQYRPAAYPDLPITYWPTSRKAWLLDAALKRRFFETVAAADGVHIHGLWEQSSLAAARTARSLAKPYIVSAHGMLEPWALAQSRLKKQVYAALFERGTLAGAACLHALTRAEARNYRDFGCKQPIAVIPNGVEVPGTLSAELFLEAYPALRGRRLMIFLGRLHRKKGVELLVRAWSQVRARVRAGGAGGEKTAADACLVLAGPSEDDTRLRVEQLVQELGLGGEILFTGMLRPQMKWSALAAAECFVLPSYSEGLSIATLEAMGAGLPVIVTENCNLPEVVEAGAGWQVRAEQGDLGRALEAWLRNAPAANQALGQRGAELVAGRYSWTRVAAQMAELYTWVEGGAGRSPDLGPAPSSLYTGPYTELSAGPSPMPQVPA